MRFVHFGDDKTVNKELVCVDNWPKANTLSLNVSKTSYMIISNQINAIDIKIRDPIVTKNSTVKFLGVTLDENLTFNDYIKDATTKISMSVRIMNRLHSQLAAYVIVSYKILCGIPV